MNRPDSIDAWRIVVEALPDGAVLIDATRPGHPVLYANPAFERMTGYTATELAGQGLRVLHGEVTSQPGLRRLRDAVEAGQATRAVVQNFRKGGEPFWMDVQIVPVRDGNGVLTHWVSLHREAEVRGAADEPGTGRFRAMAPELLSRQDSLTGFRTRMAFEELLEHQLAVAVRERQALTLFMLRVDDFERYTATFDRAAGDALLKRVSNAVASCFRRSSDLLARYEDDLFAVLTTSMDEAHMQAHGQSVCARVADLRIHHPHSRYRRYVTLSVGVAGGVPAAGTTLEGLVEAALGPLEQARAEGDAARVAVLR
jgi:diguanylate cyclase (GGDEF)-like protein/PAS domain S-box-containing protein